jgi:hypothetical protein
VPIDQLLKCPDVAVSRAADQQFVFLGHGRKSYRCPGQGGFQDGHTPPDRSGGLSVTSGP